jgi:hypothetical protein
MEKRENKFGGLVKQFAKAGLELELLTQPLQRGRNTEEIVQLDVGRRLRGSGRKEWFRLFPGHPDNRVLVQGTDRKLQQLVLFVEEPARAFEVNLPRWGNESRAAAASRAGGTIVRKRKHHWVVRQTTSADKRHFLMGVDERQLFIAQLTSGCSTVGAAHRLLGNTVQMADGRRRGSSLDRQGEWFFLETNATQREHIERLLGGCRTVVHHKVNIGGFNGRVGGNPHQAEELVVLTDELLPEASLLDNGFAARSRQVFIRGAVRHVDHRTVRFYQWREVVGNNEGATASGDARGTFWID